MNSTIQGLRAQRRKVNSDIMKEVKALIGSKHSYAKLSGNRFKKVVGQIEKVAAFDTAIKALKAVS